MAEERNFRGTGESAGGVAAERTAEGTELGSADVAEGIDVTDGATFTSEELHEFLEADAAGDLADPEFKERLRLKLWEMVQRNAGRLAPEES